MTNQAATVRHVQTCCLQTTDAAWAYAVDHRRQIDRHWDQARARNSNYFDGSVWLISDIRFGDASRTVHAKMLRTSFRACLFWRARGFEPAGVLDGFGAALIRARDGEILLARQSTGHINAGLYYPPAGFIDDHDVTSDGGIDIEASIAREAGEELGLNVSELKRGDGFWVVQSGAQVAIAITYHHRFEAGALADTIRANIRAQAEPELSDIAMVGCERALVDLTTPQYVPPLIRAVLA